MWDRWGRVGWMGGGADWEREANTTAAAHHFHRKLTDKEAQILSLNNDKRAIKGKLLKTSTDHHLYKTLSQFCFDPVERTMKKTFTCNESMIITIPIGSLKDAGDGQLMPEKFHCVFRDSYKVFVIRGKPKPLGVSCFPHRLKCAVHASNTIWLFRYIYNFLFLF